MTGLGNIKYEIRQKNRNIMKVEFCSLQTLYTQYVNQFQTIWPVIPFDTIASLSALMPFTIAVSQDPALICESQEKQFSIL